MCLLSSGEHLTLPFVKIKVCFKVDTPQVKDEVLAACRQNRLFIFCQIPSGLYVRGFQGLNIYDTHDI